MAANDPLFGVKIMGASLTALLLVVGIPQLVGAITGGEEESGEKAEDGKIKLAYPVDYQAEDAGAKTVAEKDLGTLLKEANPAAGERRATLCKSCHNLEKGGPNMQGPNLWGVVGRTVASHEGFSYTTALKSFGGEWTYERLDKFLTDSPALVPGTAMNQHIAVAAQRAELLAFLSTLSDAPVPFPAPAAPAAGADDATSAGAEAPAAPPADDLTSLLKAADPAAGARRVAICKSCHNFEKGGPNMIGPNLWGVVGRPVASHDGFTYSAALKGLGGAWTYDRLDKLLADSQGFVAGTAMNQHIGAAAQRAEILAYLRTLSDAPVPFDAGAPAEATPAPAK